MSIETELEYLEAKEVVYHVRCKSIVKDQKNRYSMTIRFQSPYYQIRIKFDPIYGGTYRHFITTYKTSTCTNRSDTLDELIKKSIVSHQKHMDKHQTEYDRARQDAVWNGYQVD